MQFCNLTYGEKQNTVKVKTTHSPRPLQLKNKHLKYAFGFKFGKLLT